MRELPNLKDRVKALETLILTYPENKRELVLTRGWELVSGIRYGWIKAHPDILDELNRQEQYVVSNLL